MTSHSELSIRNLPFLDEVFFNSPLCQICEYASIFGGVCSLLLNRRIPIDLFVKNSRIVTCSAHRNWLQSINDSDDLSSPEEFADLENVDETSEQNLPG